MQRFANCYAPSLRFTINHFSSPALLSHLLFYCLFLVLHFVLLVSYGAVHRTPENPPKCIFPSPGKILSFGADVCANPSKFGLIFGQMFMSNPGNCQGRTKVCVIIRVQSGGLE